MRYRLDHTDWVTTPANEDDVRGEELLDVLDQVPQYYAGALDSLDDTTEEGNS